MIGVVLLMLLLLTLLWARLGRDFISGLAFAIGLLVCLPTALRIQLPSGLPDLTIHRLVIVSLVIFWLRNRPSWGRPWSVPLVGLFSFWAATHFLALVFTQIDFGTSLKRFLDFVLEVFVFYVVVATTVRTQEETLRLLRAAWIGLLVVAFFAFVEKYMRFNPVDRFIPGEVRQETALADVNSTYPHRILLGTAMAMAWPLGFALAAAGGQSRISQRWAWVSVISFLSACYFAMSRGPWLAALLVGLALVALGSRSIRRKLLVIGVLVGLTVIVRPGILGSISGLAETTVEEDSGKAHSYKFRFELWKVAWSKVTESPLRLLVGYGPGVGEGAELDWTVSWQTKEQPIVSWDNHYAYDLYQAGLLGLGATLALYGGAVLITFRLWRGAGGAEKDILACFLASALALVFMMTNVLIYAKQLNFLFWLLVAAGPAIGRSAVTVDEPMSTVRLDADWLASTKPMHAPAE